MKTAYMLSFLALAGFFVACKSGSKIAAINHVQIQNDTIAGVYDHYIDLKNALITADTKAAAAAGAELAEVLGTISGCENSKNLATEISSSSDLMTQRERFLRLTTDVVPMVKNTHLNSGSIFLMYCPMAEGYWMSSEKEIRNPYYGNDMIDCGEVREEIAGN